MMILRLLVATAVFTGTSLAQKILMQSPSLNSSGTVLSQLPSNSISHIAVRDSYFVYTGTSKGLARTNSGGATWESFRSLPQFAHSSIFSLDVRGNAVWVSTGFNKPVEGEDGRTVQTGSGYTFSTDNGTTWTHVPQPIDAPGDSIVQYGSNQIKFLPIVVPEQNVTFDLSIDRNSIWISGWSSGIRKSTNNGTTWQRIVLPADNRNSISPNDQLTGYSIDPRRNNNFLGFSVYVQDDTTIWAGTAGGINKSTDGGMSWMKFSAQNQQAHILGNWVIAIRGQRIGNSTRIWCTNWRAEEQTEQFGVSYTDDGGRIWKNHLHGIKAYDFAFNDSITYVATDEGIYRTADGGSTWIRSGTIIDRNNGNRILTRQFYSVGVSGDTLYAGSGDGLVKTVDAPNQLFGITWQVLRAFQPVGTTNAVYIYPNPFSPKQEFARVHYGTGGKTASVTVEFFDFGMNRVRTLVKDATRSGANEHDEVWDGRDDAGRQVANGVYFYRVTIDNGDPSWGKVLVMQ